MTPTPESVQEQKQYPYSIKTVVNNPDGSITTTTTTYFEDGSVTELIEREWVKGKKKGRKNTKETEMESPVLGIESSLNKYLAHNINAFG